MTTLTYQQALRYSRQISLPNFDLEKQECLLASKALVIGVGGLGCAAAQFLVASGVGQLTLADDDVVDTSNLQRQVLHNESTVGDTKVASAKKALTQLNSEISIEVVPEKLTEQALEAAIGEHDIVLDCTDNLTSRQQINRYCYKLGVPLVSGAAIRMEGQVFCVVPSKKSACYACFSLLFNEQELSCVEAGVMSPLVGIIGSMQALQAIKLLANYGDIPVNQLQFFDAMTSNWQTFNISARPNCPVCGN